MLLQAGIDVAYARMRDAELQMLRTALAERWPVVGRVGPFYAGGPPLVRITVPDSWILSRVRSTQDPYTHDFYAANYDAEVQS